MEEEIYLNPPTQLRLLNGANRSPRVYELVAGSGMDGQAVQAFHERRGKSKRSVFPWNIEKLHINLEIIYKIFPTACRVSPLSFLQFSVTRKPAEGIIVPLYRIGFESYEYL